MLGETASKRLRFLINCLACITAFALVLSGYLFYSRITESRRTQAATVSAIRTVLCLARQQAQSDPTIPADRRERSMKFYDTALKKINALPCK